MHDAYNHKLQREQQCNTEALAEQVCGNVPRLNQQQRIAHDSLIEAMNNGSGGIHLLNAPGGLLLARIRVQSYVSLVLALSGIAATLLERG